MSPQFPADGIQSMYSVYIISISVGVTIFSALILLSKRRASSAARQITSKPTKHSVFPTRYPRVKRDPAVVEDYHGELVWDPYRWLEDPDSPETIQFVADQNKLADQVLGECTIRPRYSDKLRQLYNYPKFGCPFKEGQRYYYFFNSGLQPQSVLYVQDSLGSSARVLLDPNLLSDDGTVALSRTSFSKDGKFMAFSLSVSGSDWVTIKVIAITDEGEGQDLEDELKFVKFSCLAWTHDNKGFFYNRYPPQETSDLGTEVEINLNQSLWYHRVGTSQDSDVMCYAVPAHPSWMIAAEVSDDGRFVLIYIEEGCDPVNRLYYVDLNDVKGIGQGIKVDFATHVVKLVDSFEAGFTYVANEGEDFVFRTNLSAPNYKLVRTNIKASSPGMVLSAVEPRSWQDLVPETSAVLEITASLKGDHLVLAYLKDVRHVLQLHSLRTGARLKTFALPIGSIASLTGRREDSEFFFKMTGFVTAGDIYRVDVANPENCDPVLFRNTKIVGLDASEFITTQVFVASKDGTKIPLFISHLKGLKLDQNNICLLYGYGGFNISFPPSFSVARLILMKHMGGVYAQANLRGGGEYGETWHQGGTLERKQNVFDDMHACAEFLISSGYTCPSKLAIQGGSNGGLLVGACINQRPDLYGCGVAQVGVMDMLRFHKFTIGHAWCTEFGCSDKAEDFEWLYKYSPLHNVKKPSGGAQFPSMLLLTGDHDDRVVPLHSLKYIAEVQHKLCHPSSNQRNPIIVKIDTKSGHGAGKPTDKLLEETADIYAFISHVLEGGWTD